MIGGHLSRSASRTLLRRTTHNPSIVSSSLQTRTHAINHTESRNVSTTMSRLHPDRSPSPVHPSVINDDVEDVEDISSLLSSSFSSSAILPPIRPATSSDGPVYYDSKDYDINTFNLHPMLKTHLEKNLKVDKLFPVQASVMSPMQSRRDIICKSKTGTGKTWAYLLPIVNNLLVNGCPTPKPHATTVLIMEPTRELVNQVSDEIRRLNRNIIVARVYGGAAYMQQRQALARGAHVVVATPGRLMEMVTSGVLDLATCSHVVLDEADTMFRSGFSVAIETALLNASPKRQVSLFSATISQAVAKLAAKFTRHHVYLDCTLGVETGATPDLITHKACVLPIERHQIGAVLLSLMKAYSANNRCIVFTDQKGFAMEIEALINNEVMLQNGNNKTTFATALHGGQAQMVREGIVSRFRDDAFKVLVATDIAARGLDIPDVDLVVQFGVPQNLDAYVHRAGRTGRAGQKGTCVLMYRPDQRKDVNTLAATGKIRFSQVTSSEMRTEPVPTGVYKKIAKSIQSQISLMDSKRASGITAATSEAAARMTDEIVADHDPKDVIKVLIEKMIAVQLPTQNTQKFSLLSSRINHTTVRYEDDHAIASDVASKIAKTLNVDINMVQCQDFMITSQGAYFDIPDEFVELLAAAIEQRTVIGFSIPQRLPPEMFQTAPSIE